MAKALTAWVFTLAPLVQAYTYIKEVCPQNCNETGLHRTNWTYFHDLERLRYCEQPYLFETTIYTPATSSVIRACALSEATNTNTIQQVASKSRSDFGSSTNVTSGPLACGVAGSPISNRQGELHISWAANLSSLSSSAGTVASATQLLQQYIVADGDCNTTAIFASLGHVIVGAYVGSQVQKASAGSVLQQVIDQTRAGDAQHIVRAAEVCTKIQDSVLSYQTIGIFASAEGNVSAVQDALVNWNDGKCLLSNTTTSNIPITVKILSGIQGGGSGTLENNRTVSSRDNPNSGSPATCKYVQAVKDDNCWSLATQKCGITTDDFYKYNANGDWDKFCSGILPGDYVCCSAGMPPDFSPKPNPDGTCASYTVAANDGCKAIASKNSIKDYKKLDDFNKNTWGWQGCDVGLGLGQIICISSGSPNMPAYNPNAVCGPQVVGTQKPTNGTDWALLNQCPLNACCDAWGQCGKFL
jgi:chitinase